MCRRTEEKVVPTVGLPTPKTFHMVFSAPEPKAQVHYCDHTLSVVRPSVVRPSVVRPSVVNFHIFNFSSETAKENSTKLVSKQDLNVIYQVCGFLGWSEKQDGRPELWLAETLFTSSPKPLKGMRRNLTGSKIPKCSTEFVYFGPIGKPRWPSRPLIGWDIIDFSSETAEPNGKKLNRKQDLKVLYQVSVFRADRKNKMAAIASDLLRRFWLFLWNCWKEFDETWQEARSQCPLASLCFSGRSENQDGCPGLWLVVTRLLRHLFI